MRKPPGMFGASEQADTHTTTHTKLLVEYSPGKPLEAKLSSEFVFNICSESSNQGASVKTLLQVYCCRLLTIQKVMATIIEKQQLSTSGRNGGIGNERMASSRWEASIRPAHERRFRGHLGTDSVRYKLPPLCAPGAPSPVSREASLEL